jgi:uncharacterized protein YbjQ (UPF0145 family)
MDMYEHTTINQITYLSSDEIDSNNIFHVFGVAKGDLVCSKEVVNYYVNYFSLFLRLG